MAKLKIISNPYKKEIRYQKWQDNGAQWIDIDYSNCKNSKLLSQELSKGFFPFCVKKIVDAIIEEYGAEGESIQVFFEGSADEFKELEAACAYGDCKGAIVAERSDTGLENARDILPEVKKLFQEMNPLIMQSVTDQEKIQRDLNRFTDASSDVVPVCVLGNYSAGKSTFINSLIGSEILPSGIEPITAKIYKIARSKYPDRASVKCQYQDQDVILLFTDTETKFESTTTNALSIALNAGLEAMNGSSIVLRVNKALSIINDFENNVDETLISDLIEVEIPFSKGVLAQSQHPFVLFDTPGSNSASNAKHLMVLKEAMANMTNGLPIFLSTPDALDSTDNENLYHIIRDIEELDSRFTMIVVNKADGPGLQRRDSTDSEENRILSQAVPRNLYSGGLFYVSSILGLGSKNNGEFLDEFYAETYDDQVYKYNNPNERRYKTLYSFNIMPAQLKQRSDNLAASHSDLVYANSGLFSIETEIENFAGKYSSYNKCFQSQMFLKKVLEITADEIEQQKEECDGIRQSIKEKLEEDKAKLIEKLEQTAADERQEYDDTYGIHMSEYLEGIEGTFSAEDLSVRVEELTKDLEGEMGYDDRQDEVKKSFADVGGNLKDKFNNAPKKFSIATLKSMATGFADDVSAVRDAYKAQKDTRHQVDKAAADQLLEIVTNDYIKRLESVHDLLDEKSQEYWTENTESLRKILAKVVTGSEVLTDERREELERIIITYQKLSFPETPAEEIFNKENFEYHVKVFNQVLWQSDHLNVDKLARTYSMNFANGVENRYKSIEESHRESAHTWIQSLLNEIYSNIVKYSPELSKHAKRIQMMTEQIQAWEQRRIKLGEYTEKLCSMMDWKTV